MRKLPANKSEWISAASRTTVAVFVGLNLLLYFFYVVVVPRLADKYSLPISGPIFLETLPPELFLFYILLGITVLVIAVFKTYSKSGFAGLWEFFLVCLFLIMLIILFPRVLTLT